MQKVSKQSLAMIALSILLAISIALTFTFAALQDRKTATGTITFSGDASVTWSGTGLGTLLIVTEILHLNLTTQILTSKQVEIHS